MTAIRVQFTRWLYQHGRPNRLARTLNRISALQFSSGKLAPRNWVTLEVPGRRTGKPVTFPLVVAEHEGERYLVSMLGATSNWVANVRAAGGHAVIHHGKSENVLLTDVDPDARAPILRRYLAVAPGARPHMAVDPRAPLPDFDHVAAQYPVFHVTHDPVQQPKQPAAVQVGSRLLGAGLILLGTAVAAVAVLGRWCRVCCATGWNRPARRAAPWHPSSLLELDFGRRQSSGPRKARATTRSAFPLDSMARPAPVPGVKDAPCRFAMACGRP
ncbi:nitroreductase/quinone reductase family protein [Actinoplanes xinjiangensis]|uniref:Deazaflavin-dependent oxidoreductase (Nitroreductase family) n=1 Tax=Actinoplanes xinjiangensis TaxID=512350 RepID=A0A316EKT3_9ACTN|nr:nitroreductase/quinone reductase family protein [Actinoplanes xinjiangensis]PWK32452.1 deazaflavin-dependent oxidoreductase (nitroreductase family) [Actinoplanes xinjiangensis]GIF45069.1 hypothetical protein Axi01nite_93800 [Actinoplanes xinjiangensis]